MLEVGGHDNPMNSVQVGKSVFLEESYTTLGIKPRTHSTLGRSGYYYSIQLGKKNKNYQITCVCYPPNTGADTDEHPLKCFV